MEFNSHLDSQLKSPSVKKSPPHNPNFQTISATNSNATKPSSNKKQVPQININNIKLIQQSNTKRESFSRFSPGWGEKSGTGFPFASKTFRDRKKNSDTQSSESEETTDELNMTSLSYRKRIESTSNYKRSKYGMKTSVEDRIPPGSQLFVKKTIEKSNSEPLDSYHISYQKLSNDQDDILDTSSDSLSIISESDSYNNQIVDIFTNNTIGEKNINIRTDNHPIDTNYNSTSENRNVDIYSDNTSYSHNRNVSIDDTSYSRNKDISSDNISENRNVDIYSDSTSKSHNKDVSIDDTSYSRNKDISSDSTSENRNLSSNSNVNNKSTNISSEGELEWNLKTKHHIFHSIDTPRQNDINNTPSTSSQTYSQSESINIDQFNNKMVNENNNRINNKSDVSEETATSSMWGISSGLYRPKWNKNPESLSLFDHQFPKDNIETKEITPSELKNIISSGKFQFNKDPEAIKLFYHIWTDNDSITKDMLDLITNPSDSGFEHSGLRQTVLPSMYFPRKN